MTADARLQQLRRAWDEGDLDAQVRLLRERMRAGELSEDRVRLAGALGDPTCQVLGFPGAPDHGGAAAAFGRTASIRACLAALNIRRAGDLDDQGQRTLRKLEQACLCPDYSRAALREGIRLGGGAAATHALANACLVAIVPDVLPSLRRCLEWTERLGEATAMQAAIRAELVPWALGLRDPVAERVAAREAGEH